MFKEQPYYRRDGLNISIEGPCKTGISSILRALARLPWLSDDYFYVDDFSPCHRLLIDPRTARTIRWYSPYLVDDHSGPSGQWTLLDGKVRPMTPTGYVKGTAFMERSQANYDRVIWPMIDALHSRRHLERVWAVNSIHKWVPNGRTPLDRPYRSPWPLATQYGELAVKFHPDVLIVLSADFPTVLRRLEGSPVFLHMSQFMCQLNKDLYAKFPGPKFKIDCTRRRSLDKIIHTVTEIVVWIKALHMGCARSGLGMHEYTHPDLD